MEEYEKIETVLLEGIEKYEIYIKATFLIY